MFLIGFSVSAGGIEVAQAKFVQHHSSVEIERVLRKIAYVAFPNEKLFAVHPLKPIGASVSANSIAYRTRCNPTDGGIMLRYWRGPAWTTYRTCGTALLPSDIRRPSRLNEFKPTMLKLANSISKSIGISLAQVPKSVGGTRARLELRLKCPHPSILGIDGNVKQVVLRKARKGSRAVLETCS